LKPQTSFGAITRFAPAKINLALHVVGRRADGYHLLDSVVAFADCGDRITVEASDEDVFSVSGRYAEGVPTDVGNLVLRARDALRLQTGGGGPVRIHLEKTLPIASGIGGGSSDAAATLKALRALWQADVSDEGLAALGLSLGADVPMCLVAKPARITGIGEGVQTVSGVPAFSALLVNPGVSVSTPTIFSRLQSRDNPPLSDLPADGAVEGWIDWLRATRNDLQSPAVEVAPVIADVLAALGYAGAVFARMSGSGATCFGLFRTSLEASHASAMLKRDHRHWYVQQTTLAGSEHAS